METVSSGAYKIARIRGIKARDIGNSFDLEVDGTGNVRYSPLNYCVHILADNTQDPKLIDAVKALCRYWQAAAEY